jgi:hypothetical protein
MEMWLPVFTLIAANFALIIPLFLWNRAESRSDVRHMDAKLEITRVLVRAIHEESKEVISAIREEMKDFHGRLCAIEERNKK